VILRNSLISQRVLFFPSRNFFDSSQIFCQGKIFEIPQSTLCWSQNTKSQKHWKLHRIYKIVCNIRHICSDFAKFAYFPEGFDFSRAETFLIRLRFFVQEKYLRSRRAPSAEAKTLKVKNIGNCTESIR